MIQESEKGPNLTNSYHQQYLPIKYRTVQTGTVQNRPVQTGMNRGSLDS